MAAPALDVHVRLSASCFFLDDTNERLTTLSGGNEIDSKDNISKTNAYKQVESDPCESRISVESLTHRSVLLTSIFSRARATVFSL